MTETSDDHPTPFQLERLHAGEDVPEAAAHATGCDACSAYLDGLAAERGALHDREAPADFARRIRAVSDQRDESAAGRRLWTWLVPVAGLAAAAALAAMVVWPPSGSVGPGPDPTGRDLQVLPGAPVDTIRVKGGAALAFLVERDGVQLREEGALAVHEGDRLRVALQVAEPGIWTVGVLTDDGQWIELAKAADLDPGEHVFRRTLKVDSEPMEARVLAGPPDAVNHVRAGRERPDVLSLGLTGPAPDAR